MEETTLNVFDCIVILILLSSAALAFFRGFVREVLSLGAWIGAAVITIYAFEPVSEMLKKSTDSDTVAYVLAGAGTYLVALIGISIINFIIIRYVKSGSEVGMLDNQLGLLFGFLRGAFIVSLAYIVLTLVYDKENLPEWVEEAATRPFVEEGAMILAHIAPGILDDISSINEAAKDAAKGSDKEADKEKGEAGYTDQQRQLLDSIMNPDIYDKSAEEPAGVEPLE